MILKQTLLSLMLLSSVSIAAQKNPVLPDFHADPEIMYSEQTHLYYIYSTTDGFPGWGGWTFSVFSSPDLKATPCMPFCWKPAQVSTPPA